MEKIGCTACHQGRGRATSFVNAVHTPASKEARRRLGQVLRHQGVRALASVGPAHAGQGAHRVAVRQVPPGRRRRPQGRQAQRRRPADREVRLLRLPQDQGLGEPAQGGAGPLQDHVEDQRGLDLPLDQGAESLPRRPACRKSGTCGRPTRTRPSARRAATPRSTRSWPTSRTSRSGSRTRTRPEAIWRRGGTSSRRSAAWPATGSATTSVEWWASLRPRSGPTARTSTGPAAS